MPLMSKGKPDKTKKKKAIYNIIIRAEHSWKKHPDIEEVYEEMQKMLFHLKLEDVEHELFVIPSNNKKQVKVKVEIEGE